MVYSSLINQVKPIGPITEHALSIPELCDRFRTNAKLGLSQSVAAIRLQHHGPNQFSEGKEKPVFLRFLKVLFTGFSLLMWVAAALSLGVYFMEDEPNIGNLYITVALVTVIIVTGAFSFYQEGKSSKVMKTFLELVPARAAVIRDGETKSILAKEIVVGDVVVLEMGDQTPADLRIVESKGLKIDNSAITGEAKPITKKNDRCKGSILDATNLVFSATSVVEGQGKGIVLRTGDSTVMGGIAKLTGSIKGTKSTLAQDISLFMKIIVFWAVLLGLVFLTTMLLLGYSWKTSCIFLIGITVSCVPEGLIATLTLCLTLAAKRMSEKNCLVKKLKSVETLGATSIICSDKTGTLTQNKMTVANMWCDQRIRDFISGVITSERRKVSFQKLARCAILCSNAEFARGTRNATVMQRDVVGDASESAILKFIEFATRGDVKKTRFAYPKVFEIPFNSTNKFQLSVHTSDDAHLLVMKGAPEKVLDKCSTIFLEKGEKNITLADSGAVLDACTAFASEGKRVLAFCDSENFEFDETVQSEDFEVPQFGLRFLGLIALLDPPRPNVPEAVISCRKAGIKVIMVTGDHRLTAQSIAKQVHIISDYSYVQHGLPDDIASEGREKQAIVLEGTDLDTLESEELDNIVSEYEELVFARTTPKQKLEIVESCQRIGGVVAVTGDGVNDSPALKKADIGIAMGVTGSEVTKQAAEIVLLDDNFATVVTGIEEGRLVFDNLKKSISYTLSHNWPEILPIIVHVLAGVPEPLSVIAILVIDLVTDMWPAVAFAYEKPEDDLMLRKPRNIKKDRLVSFQLLFVVGHLGIIEALAGIFCYLTNMALFGWLPNRLFHIIGAWENKNLSIPDSFGQVWQFNQRKELQLLCSTSVFSSIVICQLANAVVCKSLRFTVCQRKFANSSLKNGLIFAIGISFIFIDVPGIYEVFQFRPLFVYVWFFPLAFILLMLAWDTWRKKMVQNKPNHWLFRNLTF